MNKEQLTHWKKTIDTDWIGTYVLPDDKPIIAIIDRVTYGEVEIKGKKEKSSVAHFKPNKYFTKPMLLNSTNLQRLHKLTGTPYIENWVNIPVTLQSESWSAFGRTDTGLRISPIAPKIKTVEDFPTEEKKLNDCKDLKELQSVYTSLTKDQQIVFVNLKNKLKTELK